MIPQSARHICSTRSGRLRAVAEVMGAVLLAVFAAAPGSAAAGAVERFSVTAPFDGLGTVHGSVAIRITMETSEGFEGAIVAGFRDAQEKVSYYVNVGPGQFRYEIPVPIIAPRGTPVLEVRLIDTKGREAHGRSIDVTTISTSYSSRKAATTIAWVDMRGSLLDPGGVYEVHSLPAELPLDWRCYESLDVLIIPGTAADKLSAGQVDGIVDWVRGGGTILLDGSGKDLALESDGLFSRLGITAAGEACDVKYSYTYVPTPIDLNRRRYVPEPAVNTNQPRTVLLHLKMRPLAAPATSSAGVEPLRTLVPCGLGTIILTPVNLPLFISTDFEQEVADEFINDIVFGTNDAAAIPADFYPSSFYYGYGRYPMPGWTRPAYLFNKLEPISGMFVLLYLVVFILAVCPLERAVLWRLRFFRWTWVVTVVLVVSFCVAAGSISRITRGVRPRRSTVGIHDYAEDGSGRHTMLDCVIPAASGNYHAHYALDDLELSVPADGSGARTWFLKSKRTVRFNVPVWSPYFLATSRLHTNSPPFAANVVRLSRNEIKVAVEPVGSCPSVTGMWLLWNGTQYEMERKDDPADVWVSTTRGSRKIAAMNTRDTYYAYAYGGEDLDLEKVEDDVLGYVVRLSGPANARDTSRIFFQGIKLPVLPAEQNSAVILAVCEEGEEIDIDLRDPKTRRLHVVRQMIRIDEDT